MKEWLNKHHETLLIIALAIVCILLILVLCHRLGQTEDETRDVGLKWDKYPIELFPDAVSFNIYELDSDTNIVELLLSGVSVMDTVATVTVEVRDAMRYFAITAIDTAFNESGFSNIAVLDGKAPETGKGVRAWWK